MNTLVLLLISIAVLFCGYVFYGGWVARQWGGNEGNRPTPAHTMEDGVDYVPAKAPILMGHHFSSIAGAGPITGPIGAAMFGWLPVTLWVLIGGIFFGGAYQYRDQGKGSTELMGGSTGYKNDTFKVGVGYEHESSADSYYNLAGEYYLGNNTFRAGFGYDDNKGKNDWFEYALGYQYNLSERTYTWVEGSYYDPRQKGAEDNYEVVVGVRHDF